MSQWFSFVQWKSVLTKIMWLSKHFLKHTFMFPQKKENHTGLEQTWWIGDIIFIFGVKYPLNNCALGFELWLQMNFKLLQISLNTMKVFRIIQSFTVWS